VFPHRSFRSGKMLWKSLRDIRQYLTKYEGELDALSDQPQQKARQLLVRKYIEYWKLAEQELSIKKKIGEREQKIPNEEEVEQIFSIRETQYLLWKDIKDAFFRRRSSRTHYSNT